ncbi:MAG: SHOCT domain-containing protein [Solirubrobacterales bacterium]
MPGLLRGMARTAVIAGTATAVSNRVSKRQGERWAEQEQQAAIQAQSAPESMPPAPEQSGGSSMIDQLKELGELKTQGILTEEEFAAQKAKLLGS